MTTPLVVFAVLYGIACGGIGLAVTRYRSPHVPYADPLTQVSAALGAAALIAAAFLTIAAAL